MKTHKINMCFSINIQIVLWVVSDTFNSMHLKTEQMFFFSMTKDEQSLGQGGEQNCSYSKSDRLVHTAYNWVVSSYSELQ